MPRMQMTPMVRFALWFLRIYLIVLLALIVLKFVRVAPSAKAQSGETNRSAPQMNTDKGR